jgi:hypothetical protein
MGMGQNCPKTPPVSCYHGKTPRQSLVRWLKLHSKLDIQAVWATSALHIAAHS